MTSPGSVVFLPCTLCVLFILTGNDLARQCCVSTFVLTGNDLARQCCVSTFVLTGHDLARQCCVSTFVSKENVVMKLQCYWEHDI